jgi:hypothetical protein
MTERYLIFGFAVPDQLKYGEIATINMEEFLEYLNERITMWKPISLRDQIEYFSKHGRMPDGHTGNYIPFETWKKVRRMFA